MSNYTGAVPDVAARPTDWLAAAPCNADPEAMFPGSNDHDIEYAKSICRSCSVIERCLQWALDTGEQLGVWGGKSEDDRRRLKRRAARPISIDDYTGTPRQAPGARTLEEAWAEGTEADGEHLLWVGPKVVHQTGGNVTPNRLAFRIDRGHWPEGGVKRTCKTVGCVRPAHLADRRERAEEADLAVAV